MKLQLAAISPRRNHLKSKPADALTRDYAERATRLCPTELTSFNSEGDLLESTARRPGTPAALLLLLDSRGELLTSEALAQLLGTLRDTGTQRLILAIGPADGWSKPALAQAHRVLSLGRITLPHELARAVLAEQVYRALTILAGHPYHSGH